MEENVSRKDRAILLQNEKRSKDLVDMAMKYSWNQFIFTNALCSQRECYSSTDHIIYPDLVPIYTQADNEHVKRIQQKDNTSALKLWLLQHKKTPYPSKAEKIMLAILAKMTLTQVSTWFANARRRLKKDYPDED